MFDKRHVGSSLDDLLEEEGLLTEVTTVAIKRTLAWQVEQAMKEKGLTKSAMAKAMDTSRAALERLLDPNNTSITLKTIDKAARVVGKRMKIELVDATQ
jgi:predicted transcriptional regulator